MSAGPNLLLKNGAKLVASAEDILEEYNNEPKLNLEPPKNISTKNPTEKMILDILDKKKGITTDDIIKESGLDTSQILSALSMLELKNKIKEQNGKYKKL